MGKRFRVYVLLGVGSVGRWSIIFLNSWLSGQLQVPPADTIEQIFIAEDGVEVQGPRNYSAVQMYP